jgi:phosphatidylglycerol:prolipoprotein diacylglycerol transferase
MLATIAFPTWIKPEIIPGLPFRWYGLMYVVAFAVTWFLFLYESKRRKAAWTEDESVGFFFWAIVGLLVGARIFGTLVYDDPTHYYLRKPWFIFWPFDESGRFIGFQGMSFHGGFLGVIVATLIYARVKRLSWLAWADVIAVSAPLGYTAGRLGNFINGELWGKVSDRPWAMIFPNAERYSANQTWVQEFAAKVGIPVQSMNDLVNLPRHPSQLYEALFEGIVLWLILWFVVRKRKSFKGFAVGCYAVGYGVARFVIEYFREPDAGLGYIIKLGNPNAPTYMYTTPFNFSMGQILSAIMVAGAILFLVLGAKAARKAEATAAAEASAKASAKNSSRKLKKKIK